MFCSNSNEMVLQTGKQEQKKEGGFGRGAGGGLGVWEEGGGRKRDVQT